MALLAFALACCIAPASMPSGRTPAIDVTVTEAREGNHVCRVAIGAKPGDPPFVEGEVYVEAAKGMATIEWKQRGWRAELHYILTCRMRGRSGADITLRINGFSWRQSPAVGFGRFFTFQRSVKRPVRLQPARDAVEDCQP
jgi:hypothetical protein